MKLTERQKAELQALAEMKDEDIDLSDIPERPINWKTARRGVFYRPVKQQITITLDEYVIDWFEDSEPDEQARHETINGILMEHIKRKRLPNSGKKQAGQEG